MGNSKKKLAIIGTNGIPAKHGGFETLSEYLVTFLNDDYNITVYCSKTPKEKQLKTYLNSRLVYLPFKANGWQSMTYDAISIFHAFMSADVLLILGFSGVFAFPFKMIFRKKIVFNIGGIEWQKVRGRKAFASIEVAVKKWFERICVRFSDVIIADNQALCDYVTATYNIEPVLAEYGGDHAKFHPVNDNYLRKYPFLERNYDISVSRAQEDMNIHLLLDSYKDLPHRKLVVVSNWDTSQYGITLKEKYKDKYPNIYIQDAVYDLNEINAIRSNSSIYFHTHSLCGTAPSLTEAMSLGLPVICYDVDTNRATTEGKSFYFKDKDSLIKILSEIDPDRIGRLGEDMREIAERRYTWKRIVSIYKNSID
jgi:glycosyltransferase involved in cell wall biosynthesis